jgi:hypothetical protein
VAERGGRVVFGTAGHAAAELKEHLLETGAPVEFVPMAPAECLARRLSAADVQIVSLRETWTGTVVPSKFFGALAIGRPVLFLGSPDSAIGQWIQDFRVGWVLGQDGLGPILDSLEYLADNPAARLELFQHCQQVYREHFSRVQALNLWNIRLRQVLSTLD